MEQTAVLIVDDEKNIRQTLAHALESMGLDTDGAINGEEALSKLDSKPYGVILLDLKMPGMDGIEVLRSVRQRRPNIHVVIITAHGTIESATEAMRLGAVDFIQKPFSAKEIRTLVAKVLDRDSLRAEHAKSYDEHIELAKRCIGQQEFAAAEAHVRLAIAADSVKPEAFNLLGALTELQGDWLSALKQYRAALALDPTCQSASANLHRVAACQQVGSGICLEAPETPTPTEQVNHG